MSAGRVLAGISAIGCVIGLTAIGRRASAPHQPDPKTQVESCKAAMPIIMKNYNNARYALRRAGYSADAGHILPAVNEAQAALDAMEPPLKVCSEAMQNIKGDQRAN